MANNLTGEFDVVAQFSAPAVHRLLAAMHGIKRFPHSLSLRIDDRPPRPERAWPTALEIIDLAGDPVVEPDRIQDLWPVSSGGASRFDAVINPQLSDLNLPPLVPSLLHGRAQLQLAPPTLEIVDAATSRIKIRIRVRARYLADPQTPPLAQFAVGDLVLTTTVSQITSQVGNVVNIDLRGNAVQAEFEPTWSSQALFAADRASINRLITNTLRSSVLPSNTPLPADVGAMMFKAFTNPTPAVAILLNKAAPAGNPATVNRVILGGADFAFAVGVDAVRAAFQPVLDQIFATPIQPFPVSYPGPNPTYSVVLKPPEMALRPGRIALIIKGRATTPSWHAPNFNFTITQDLTLQPAGTTAELLVGALTISTDDVLADWFRGKMLDKIRPIRDQALASSDAAGKVRTMLDTERAFGGFLRSLLTPARPDDQPQPPALPATLSYTSSHIEPDGIVLRGELTLADWGPPHVEFQQMAPVSSDPLTGSLPSGDEYSAFRSWIAGGVIDSFEWKRAFQTTPGFRDENRFVKMPEAPGLVATDALEPAGAGPMVAYRPMCLTITGRRLTATGPVVSQPVQASYCAFHWFPLLDVPVAEADSTPMVALTRPGPSGLVEVVGHTAAVRADMTRGTPNLVVHFGTAHSAGQLHDVTEAIRKSGRVETPAAVVAVLNPDDLSRARYIDGVIYAEADDRWAKTWAVSIDQRPVTVLIDASGKLAWQHGGDLEPDRLGEMLRKMLRPGRFAGASVVTTGPGLGHPPPNFLFSYGPGQELTLRKLIGRPVILMFSRQNGRTSANAAQEPVSHRHRGWEQALVLRIEDGAAPDRPVQQAAGVSNPTTVVPDPMRTIAKAYGISAWPTTVYVDAQGVVRDVRHAHFETVISAPPATGAAAGRG